MREKNIGQSLVDGDVLGVMVLLVIKMNCEFDLSMVLLVLEVKRFKC